MNAASNVYIVKTGHTSKRKCVFSVITLKACIIYRVVIKMTTFTTTLCVAQFLLFENLGIALKRNFELDFFERDHCFFRKYYSTLLVLVAIYRNEKSFDESRRDTIK